MSGDDPDWVVSRLKQECLMEKGSLQLSDVTFALVFHSLQTQAFVWGKKRQYRMIAETMIWSTAPVPVESMLIIAAIMETIDTAAPTVNTHERALKQPMPSAM